MLKPAFITRVRSARKLGQEAMEQWGWRLPFLVAGPLGAVAVYFRMKIEESPQFQATLDAAEEHAKSATRSEYGINPVTLNGITAARIAIESSIKQLHDDKREESKYMKS